MTANILGVVLRTRPEHISSVRSRLGALPGVDLVHNPGDGRLALVIEDTATRTPTASLSEIAQWPEVLGTSMVYEYSGASAPPPPNHLRPAWRTAVQDLNANTTGRA